MATVRQDTPARNLSSLPPRSPRTRGKQGGNQPVTNYEGLVIVCFRRLAGAAFRAIVEHGLRADWSQEIRLAALTAKGQGLRSREAMRLYDRWARRALKEMGFYRKRDARGSVGSFLWRIWLPLQDVG